MGMYYDFKNLPQYLELLKSKLNIAIIYGGDKQVEGAVIHQTHNVRPWKSYEKVAHDIQQALQNIGYKNVHTIPDDMNLFENLRKNNIHFVWLNTGGVQGYNPVSHTPAMLEMLGVPFVGHNSLNTSTLDNKHVFKREMESLGILTSPFIVWDASRGILIPQSNKRFKHIFGEYTGPFVVKPVSGRASLNIEVVDDIKNLAEIVKKINHITQNHVIIEKYLGGREFCVAVCGYVTYIKGEFFKRTRPFVFSEIERTLDKDEKIFTSMDVKPITGARAKLVDEKQDPEIKQQLKSLAEKTYWDVNLKSLIRLDIRANDEGDLYVLEANPKPDLKRPDESVSSLVTMGLEEHGMSYEGLIHSLLADRLDYLFTHAQRSIAYILDLIQ